jgi:hypothetical protein
MPYVRNTRKHLPHANKIGLYSGKIPMNVMPRDTNVRTAAPSSNGYVQVSSKKTALLESHWWSLGKWFAELILEHQKVNHNPVSWIAWDSLRIILKVYSYAGPCKWGCVGCVVPGPLKSGGPVWSHQTCTWN